MAPRCCRGRHDRRGLAGRLGLPTSEAFRILKGNPRVMMYVKHGAQLDRELKWLGSHRYAILNLGAMDAPQLEERHRSVRRELAVESA